MLNEKTNEALGIQFRPGLPPCDKVNNLDTNKVNHMTCTRFNNCVLVQKRLQIQYTFLLLTAFFFIPREA